MAYLAIAATGVAGHIIAQTTRPMVHVVPSECTIDLAMRPRERSARLSLAQSRFSLAHVATTVDSLTVAVAVFLAVIAGSKTVICAPTSADSAAHSPQCECTIPGERSYSRWSTWKTHCRVFPFATATTMANRMAIQLESRANIECWMRS